MLPPWSLQLPPSVAIPQHAAFPGCVTANNCATKPHSTALTPLRSRGMLQSLPTAALAPPLLDGCARATHRHRRCTPPPSPLRPQTAFYVFAGLMTRLGLRNFYLPGLPLAICAHAALEGLLAARRPVLASHLEDNLIKPPLYATPWLLSCFISSPLPPSTILCVVDRVLLEGTLRPIPPLFSEAYTAAGTAKSGLMSPGGGASSAADTFLNGSGRGGDRGAVPAATVASGVRTASTPLHRVVPGAGGAGGGDGHNATTAPVAMRVTPWDIPRAYLRACLRLVLVHEASLLATDDSDDMYSAIKDEYQPFPWRTKVAGELASELGPGGDGMDGVAVTGSSVAGDDGALSARGRPHLDVVDGGDDMDHGPPAAAGGCAIAADGGNDAPPAVATLEGADSHAMLQLTSRHDVTAPPSPTAVPPTSPVSSLDGLDAVTVTTPVTVGAPHTSGAATSPDQGGYGAPGAGDAASPTTPPRAQPEPALDAARRVGDNLENDDGPATGRSLRSVDVDGALVVQGEGVLTPSPASVASSSQLSHRTGSASHAAAANGRVGPRALGAVGRSRSSPLFASLSAAAGGASAWSVGSHHSRGRTESDRVAETGAAADGDARVVASSRSPAHAPQPIPEGDEGLVEEAAIGTAGAAGEAEGLDVTASTPPRQATEPAMMTEEEVVVVAAAGRKGMGRGQPAHVHPSPLTLMSPARLFAAISDGLGGAGAGGSAGGPVTPFAPPAPLTGAAAAALARLPSAPMLEQARRVDGGLASAPVFDLAPEKSLRDYGAATSFRRLSDALILDRAALRQSLAAPGKGWLPTGAGLRRAGGGHPAAVATGAVRPGGPDPALSLRLTSRRTSAPDATVSARLPPRHAVSAQPTESTGSAGGAFGSGTGLALPFAHLLGSPAATRVTSPPSTSREPGSPHRLSDALRPLLGQARIPPPPPASLSPLAPAAGTPGSAQPSASVPALGDGPHLGKGISSFPPTNADRSIDPIVDRTVPEAPPANAGPANDSPATPAPTSGAAPLLPPPPPPLQSASVRAVGAAAEPMPLAATTPGGGATVAGPSPAGGARVSTTPGGSVDTLSLSRGASGLRTRRENSSRRDTLLVAAETRPFVRMPRRKAVHVASVGFSVHVQDEVAAPLPAAAPSPSDVARGPGSGSGTPSQPAAAAVAAAVPSEGSVGLILSPVPPTPAGEGDAGGGGGGGGGGDRVVDGAVIIDNSGPPRYAQWCCDTLPVSQSSLPLPFTHALQHDPACAVSDANLIALCKAMGV